MLVTTVVSSANLVIELEARMATVVSSANLMIELEACVATQSWVNREYRAENAPLWGPSVDNQWGGYVVSYLHHLGAIRQKVQDPVAQGGV